MAKINLNGEWHEFDFSHKPMSEALAVEKAAGMRYVDWETELAAGSMKAMCVLVWLIWRRNGRDVDLDSILSGETDVDLMPLLESLQASAEEAQAQQEKPGPTAPGISPEPTPTTPANTSRSSRRSTASGPGKSAS